MVDKTGTEQKAALLFSLSDSGMGKGWTSLEVNMYQLRPSQEPPQSSLQMNLGRESFPLFPSFPPSWALVRPRSGCCMEEVSDRASRNLL